MEKPARRRRERKEGWLGGDQGGRGEERRERGEVFPSLLPLFFCEPEPRLLKRASKIKLKIDVASKHPAPACASLHPPFLLHLIPPRWLALYSVALTSIGSYCTYRVSWQRPIVFAPFTPSSSPPTSPPSLQPQNRTGVWSTVIVIPKTNWPSFNSTDKCKKLAPQRPGCLRSVCVCVCVCGPTKQHNHPSPNNAEEPI